jgi:hypothetical protein
VKRLIDRDRKEFLGNKEMMDKYKNEFGEGDEATATAAAPTAAAATAVAPTAAAPAAAASAAAAPAAQPAAATPKAPGMPHAPLVRLSCAPFIACSGGACQLPCVGLTHPHLARTHPPHPPHRTAGHSYRHFPLQGCTPTHARSNGAWCWPCCHSSTLTALARACTVPPRKPQQHQGAWLLLVLATALPHAHAHS